MFSQLTATLWSRWPGLDALFALAQTPAPGGTPAAPPPDAGGSWMMLALPLAFIGVYLLMSASQVKRQKEHAKTLESLKPGDEIVTMGGIFGVITQVKPDRLVVEIAKGTRVELRKSHVESRVAAAEEKTGS